MKGGETPIKAGNAGFSQFADNRLTRACLSKGWIGFAVEVRRVANWT
jgi:hypothetical protein